MINVKIISPNVVFSHHFIVKIFIKILLKYQARSYKLSGYEVSGYKELWWDCINKKGAHKVTLFEYQVLLKS